MFVELWWIWISVVGWIIRSRVHCFMHTETSRATIFVLRINHVYDSQQKEYLIQSERQSEPLISVRSIKQTANSFHRPSISKNVKIPIHSAFPHSLQPWLLFDITRPFIGHEIISIVCNQECEIKEKLLMDIALCHFVLAQRSLSFCGQQQQQHNIVARFLCLFNQTIYRGIAVHHSPVASFHAPHPIRNLSLWLCTLCGNH